MSDEVAKAFRADYDAKLQVVQAGVERFADLVLPNDFAATLDDYTHEALIAYSRLLKGPGKRGRGVFAVAGYELARELYGGDAPYNEILIGNVAGILEGVQAMLLAIDDMADNDDRRRGLSTVHAQLREVIAGREGQGDAAERGRDYTVLCCLIINNLVQKALLQLPASDKQIKTAGVMLTSTLIDTARGQGWDMKQLEPSERISVERTLQTAQDKTARYSVEGPWKLGALFGSMPENMRDSIATYSEKVGQAFQIRDDILGTFGDSEVTGKGNDGDFRERKRTMLVALAHEHASERDLRKLDEALADGTSSGFTEYKDVLERSGVVRMADEMVANLTEQAMKALPSDWPERHVAFLRGIAASNLERRK